MSLFQGVDALERVVSSSCTSVLLKDATAQETPKELYMLVENFLFDRMDGVPGGAPYEELETWTLNAMSYTGQEESVYKENVKAFFRKIAKRDRQKKGRVEEIGQRLTRGQQISYDQAWWVACLMTILAAGFAYDLFIVQAKSSDEQLLATKTYIDRVIGNSVDAAASYYAEGSTAKLVVAKMVALFVGVKAEDYTEIVRAKAVESLDLTIGDVLSTAAATLGPVLLYTLMRCVYTGLKPKRIGQASTGFKSITRTVKLPTAGPGSVPFRPLLES